MVRNTIAISPTSEKRTRFLFLPLTINIVLEVSAEAIKLHKDDKGIWTGIWRKKENYLFTDDTILFLENSRHHQKKYNLLVLIINSAKLQYKKSVHKNQLPLYNKNEQSRKKIKTILFLIVSKWIK